MKKYTLSQDQVQVQLLGVRTMVRAGKDGCFRATEAEAKACCDALENVSHRNILTKSDEYYCLYQDTGTGDWDVSQY